MGPTTSAHPEYMDSYKNATLKERLHAGHRGMETAMGRPDTSNIAFSLRNGLEKANHVRSMGILPVDKGVIQVHGGLLKWEPSRAQHQYTMRHEGNFDPSAALSRVHELRTPKTTHF